MPNTFLIYGANGYTGELITRMAAERGLKPILAGRNEAKIAEFAAKYGFEHRAFSLDESEKVDAALRELREETGVTLDGLEPLYTAGDPGRDPRGWTVSVVYLVRVDAKAVKPKAADDAKAVKWWPLDAPPPMAFDHGMLLERARARLLERAI